MSTFTDYEMNKMPERDLDKYLPSDDASIIKKARDLKSKAKGNRNTYLKNSEKARYERDRKINKERRKFLEMTGKAGISAKLLSGSALIGGLMANRQALAQDLSNKRVVWCYLNSGATNDHWLPQSATQMNQVTQPYGPGGYDVADVCHFRHVNAVFDGHSNAHQAVGGNYGVDGMDVRLAEVLGGTTPYSAIYTAIDASHEAGNTIVSHIGPPIQNPQDALNRFFGAAPEISTDSTYLKSFSRNLKAIESIKSKLSQEEIERMDKHADALLKIENRIKANEEDGAIDINACKPSADYQDNMQSRCKAQADIIIAALQCGLTKVATLQCGNHQAEWRAHNTGWTGDHHGSCHGVSDPGPNIEMVRYISDVPAYFIKRLMEEDGPDGQKLIDTTVFVQVTCMGNGMDHTPGNSPNLVATRMPGFTQGFSSRAAGNIYDLNGAIPQGLGLAPTGDLQLERTNGDTIGLV